MQPPAPILPPPKVKKKKRRNYLLRFIGWSLATTMLLFLAGSAVAAYLLWQIASDLPDYDKLAEYEPPIMTRVHAYDGSLLAEYARQRRIYVPINAVPKQLIHAFLSAEDKNFFAHKGLDPKGILRAIITNVKNYGKNRRLVGASTITQQVAKNFLLSSEQKLERKIKEAILAVRIEQAYTKEQILELYLNEIYLGLHSYGIAAAALNYYGKSLNELTLPEMAYLAALPKAPNNYHPFRKTQAAITRRNWVIDQMVKNGYVTPEDGEAAKKTPLNVNPRPFGTRMFAAEFFAEEVRRELMARYGEKKLYEGGLSVRSTLDPKLQVMARKALIDGLVRYDRRHGWRGPIQTLDISGDWGAKLAEIDALDDIKPWRMAVVLSVSAKQAVIGLRPERNLDGKLPSERETGIIPYEEVKWARPRLSSGKRERLGRRPRTVDAVLKPGDVIYVAPVEKKKNKKRKTKREQDEALAQNEPKKWRLMQIPEVGGAIVVMDPHTGRVLALVGGFSFDASEFNRATQAMRQPGSAFKPFVYAAALDNGYTPASVVLDAPLAIDQGGGQGVWRPKNYGKGFAGPSTLRTGIERSRNLMTVRLAQDIGMPLIVHYAKLFGIYDDLLPVLSMALGAGETTLLRLTTAYCILANGGKQVRPTLIDRIQDRYGRTIYRHDPRQCPDCTAQSWQGQDEPQLIDNRKQIIDPQTAYQITSMLEGVVKRGTGRRVAAVGKPLAGKTGTTNDEKDAWFIGFSPDLVAGVFVGFDTPRPMGKGETGGAVASPIFRDFMKMALADKPSKVFRQPPGMTVVWINRRTGLRANPGDPYAIREAFKPNTEPPMGNTTAVGFINSDGNAFVGPEAYRGLTSGTGGLY